MAYRSQLCESCGNKVNKDCYCAPNSVCSDYFEEKQDTYLSGLFERLHLTEVNNAFARSCVAAMVYEVLRSNKCGLNGDNNEHVIETLISGVCSRFEFNVLSLAASWGNDIEHYVREYIGFEKGDLYREYIFKYVSEHEVVSGVKMDY